MDRAYNPVDWYWIVGGDLTQVFSSLRNTFVPVTDANYAAWGSAPSRIDTIDSLKAVLTDAAVSPSAPVSPAKARVVLAAAGHLDAVEAAVASAPKDVQLYWQHTTEIHRTHPFVEQLRLAIGMSEADADALFAQAAQ